MSFLPHKTYAFSRVKVPRIIVIIPIAIIRLEAFTFLTVRAANGAAIIEPMLAATASH